MSLLAVGYGIERAITGIRPRWLREVVGWAATAIEVDCVLGNVRVGVRLRF